MSNSKYTWRYLIERFYPIILSGLAIILFIIYRHRFVAIDKMVNQMCDNGISLSVTLAGFFLTILTLIKSITTRRMSFVVDGGGLPLLLMYLKHAIQYNIILLLSSFIIKYVEHRASPMLYIKELNIVDSAYVFIFILTIFISIRFTQLFVSLLADPPQNSSLNDQQIDSEQEDE